MSTQTPDVFDYGIKTGVSVPELARKVGLNRKTLDKLIEDGDGPRVVEFRHPSGRVTRRVTQADAIRWLRARTMEV